MCPQVLTAEKAFLALSLYNTVRLSMTLFFPFAISMLGECRASIDRVQDFLLLEERDAHTITRTFHTSCPEVYTVKKVLADFARPLNPPFLAMFL